MQLEKENYDLKEKNREIKLILKNLLLKNEIKNYTERKNSQNKNSFELKMKSLFDESNCEKLKIYGETQM